MENIPPHLYKYSALGAALRILMSKKIRYTAPSALNDPLECYPLVQEHSTQEARPSLTQVNECIFFQHIAYLRSCVGILSLSESNISPLLWAHYGGQHTGIVIGFHSAANLFSRSIKRRYPQALLPVHYSDTRFTLTMPTGYAGTHLTPSEFYAEGDISLRDLFARKSKHWSYEQEWRSVRLSKAMLRSQREYSDQERLHSFVADDISFIGLGAGIRFKFAYRIYDLLHRIGYPIALFDRAYFANSDYVIRYRKFGGDLEQFQSGALDGAVQFHPHSYEFQDRPQLAPLFESSETRDDTINGIIDQAEKEATGSAHFP